MVDRHVIQARLAKIREYVALLRKIRGLADEEHFLKDPLIYGNALLDSLRVCDQVLRGRISFFRAFRKASQDQCVRGWRIGR